MRIQRGLHYIMTVHNVSDMIYYLVNVNDEDKHFGRSINFSLESTIEFIKSVNNVIIDHLELKKVI